MASLEYLTQNSLTAYPFKGRLPSSAYREHPIQDDWFYDILFVSYSKEIYRVYISKIEKEESNSLKIFLNNAVSLEPLLYTVDEETEQQVAVPVTLNSEQVVNHYQNTSTSFSSVSFEKFAIKFVFGPG